MQAIPYVLAGRDLLGLAQTGTGKTAAFALPILQGLAERGVRPHGDRPIRVLVLTPTRELAAQIGDSFERYGKHLGYRHTVIFGGVGQNPQVRALRAGVDILVATPGRLLDLHGQRQIHLSHLEVFVLDEADRMLDMGFIHDVKRVIAMLPQRRQTLFFSATMPPEAKELANAILRDPETVAVTPVSSTVDRIAQWLYFVEKDKKRELLVDLLTDRALERVLVFSRTKHGANRIAEVLHKRGVRAEAIHGNKSQGARERALANFKSGTSRVLVATDIAARGIDIDDVTHVVNFDLPNVPETYVHRIGRTARAGAEGVALSFCDTEEREYLIDIERLIGKHIPRVEDHSFRSPLPPPPETNLSARRGQARPAAPAPRHQSAGRPASPARHQPAARPASPARHQPASQPGASARPHAGGGSSSGGELGAREDGQGRRRRRRGRRGARPGTPPRHGPR